MEASRLANPVPQGFSYHIANFLANVQPSLIKHFAVPYIASALVLDSHPPEMHGK
jgi:hypothetical protein